MTVIGKEACCRAVDTKMVQLLIYSMFGSGCTAAAFGMTGNGSVYVNGRLVFSCAFLRGDGE